MNVIGILFDTASAQSPHTVNSAKCNSLMMNGLLLMSVFVAGVLGAPPPEACWMDQQQEGSVAGGVFGAD
jgi:hypothetical protein